MNSPGDVRRAHGEWQRTQSQLIEAAKVESATRLATDVAHELKGPLMTLCMGMDRLLSRNPENSDEAQAAQAMKEAVQQASNVLNVLLDYSHLRPTERSAGNIHDIIDSSLALVRHQLDRRHVTVVREFAPSLPSQLLDRVRVEHLFVNLFLSAMQAMPAGGTLSVRTFTPSLVAGGNDDLAGVIVEIDGTAYGGTPENAGRPFEPFFTTEPPGQGTSLVLALARKVMQVHRGSILLSHPNHTGARATLRFNTEPEEQPC